MSRSFRRFEILLPLRFNDGTSVPASTIADVILELRARFGAVSAETQTIQGSWTHEAEVYQDDLLRLFVDVAEEASNRDYFVELKERLKAMFDQLDIWITTYPVEVI
jgi:hypothetical protein